MFIRYYKIHAGTLYFCRFRQANAYLTWLRTVGFPAKTTTPIVMTVPVMSNPEKKAKVQKQSSIFDHFTRANKSTTADSISTSQTQVDAKIITKNNTATTTELASTSASASASTATATSSSTTTSVTVTSTKPFDLDALSEEERLLFELELTHLPQDWLPYLWDEVRKPYFKTLKAFLQGEWSKGVKVFPPAPAIYRWAQLCPFSQIKVVIIGQDPYHNDGQAMGLCFSVPPTMRPLPPSLLNIYKELATDIPSFGSPPKHGDLSGWAKQGVLLLNTSLTVRAHEPASHAGRGWEQFTDAVIRAINLHRHHCVFILWGNHAQKKSPMIDKGRHLVLPGVHPSPLSASRGFFGCQHFSKTNAYLASHGLGPIDWASL